MKKKIIIIFSFFLLGVFGVICFAEKDVGDVDGNNIIEYNDAMLILQYISGDGNLTLEQFDKADVNGDGMITVVDASQIIHYVNNVFNELPYSGKYNAKLTITSFPNKTEYIEGEELDLSGLELAVEYGNGMQEIITEDYSYSGWSPSHGIKIIVISYKDAKIAFCVTVYPK